MAKQWGKYKLSKREFEFVRLQSQGGTIGGSLNVAGPTSIEGDLDLGQTLSGSGGSFIFPGDLNFATLNADDRTTIFRTTGIGSTLGIYNNLLYIDGTNLGIGTVTPSAKLEVAGNIVFSDLPTTQPTVTGSLWLSGSDGNGKSQFLTVFTG
tara:strand:- start:56 stop:511 length:456 start_codon:yes stop_codon:yes gene_type:complete